MNCCDYDCTQGRNCPARVAPVGKRVDVSRVQLDRMTPAVRRGVWPQLVRRVAQWLGALAVVAIWMLACVATEPSSAPRSDGTRPAKLQVTT